MALSNQQLPDKMAEKSQLETSNSSAQVRPKVLFFDVNETLLDLSILKKEVAETLEGREDLLGIWFTTMLHYSLVTSASGQYEHFGNIGAAALQMVAASNDIPITKAKARDIVIGNLRNLQAHPEVKSALSQLKSEGYTLASFTNGSNEGVKEQFQSAGLTDYFDARLSVEDVGQFKPFKATYEWAAQKMGIRPHEAMLIAAHGWDVAGALWAGWRAAFISRPGQQLFPLAPNAEINAPDLQKVADILVSYK